MVPAPSCPNTWDYWMSPQSDCVELTCLLPNSMYIPLRKSWDATFEDVKEVSDRKDHPRDSHLSLTRYFDSAVRKWVKLLSNMFTKIICYIQKTLHQLCTLVEYVGGCVEIYIFNTISYLDTVEITSFFPIFLLHPVTYITN